MDGEDSKLLRRVVVPLELTVVAVAFVSVEEVVILASGACELAS